MSGASDLRARLAELGESQWGLLTTAQASDVDVDPKQLQRLVDHGVLARLRYGVYRLAGVPDSPVEPLRAEWLALDPARTVGERISDEVPLGVVSHRSAADLQGLGDLGADYLEFTVPARRSSRNPDVRFHRALLAPDDWILVDGLPVTTPARTIGDLAAARTDGGHLATVVRDALLQGASADEIAEELHPYAHRYGAPVDDGSALINHFITQAGVPESSLALSAPTLQPVIAAKDAFDKALNELARGRFGAHLDSTPFAVSGGASPREGFRDQHAMFRLASELVQASLREQRPAATSDPAKAALNELRLHMSVSEQLTEFVRQAMAPLTETPEWAEAVRKISTRIERTVDPAELRGAASIEQSAAILSEAVAKALIDTAFGAERPPLKAAP
ncbi:type IV toxin-antitoxin system AbiEi family antitoxin domain-containing protein [Nocardia alba]|uniref:Putative AbiEi antitoxin of type IV toxin-antitoxin system n=1 Tax=Nocardia alba TaxID=225051 RepID=A0A4V2P9L2_9NOCA|nr:type IV toxin-antitoxin system AbiEi family antitoxin domain-containing protein [Nocardia alba]TCJ89915.1 putative AbiEi antitoxin of type IV toxin-antitoxin system [Nocardia alba]